MDCIKKHNNKIGGFGIYDNPRNCYRIYSGVIKPKWWRYSLFWYVVVILRNA